LPFGLLQPVDLWAYLLLAFVVIIEGPVATLAGAVAASAGIMEPWGVFWAAALANIGSDFLWYFLGYIGKTGWLLRYGSWFGLKEEHITHFEEDVIAHAPKLLVMAKLTLGFSIPTLVAIGMARVPWKRWFWALVVAETLWSGTLVFLGYHFGRYLRTLEWGIQIVAISGSLAFFAVVLYYFSKLRRRMK
jgi:membrane protein DedA with SNARE-associated domain